MNTNNRTADWTSHYEALDDSFELFELEAADYVRRLLTVVDLRPEMALLDFGCGFGFVAERVGQRVGELYVWDVTRNMRERCVRRVSRRCPVTVLDLQAGAAGVNARVDMILVNSVIQYMTLAELRNWLREWAILLRPAGRIVLSDVISLDSTFVSEVRDSLLFATRQGFLLRSLRETIAGFRRYAQMRRSHPLLRLSAGELAREATAAGLRCEQLANNLTYRRNRVSVILTRE